MHCVSPVMRYIIPTDEGQKLMNAPASTKSFRALDKPLKKVLHKLIIPTNNKKMALWLFLQQKKDGVYVKQFAKNSGSQRKAATSGSSNTPEK